MPDIAISVPIKRARVEVFDEICGLFRDSFNRGIMLANYMGPRLVGVDEIERGAEIEAFIQLNNGKDLWAEGKIQAFDKENCILRFYFNHTAYHKFGDTITPKYRRVDLNRRALFIFHCSEGQSNSDCTLNITLDLEKKMFGGVGLQAMMGEVLKFFEDRGITPWS